MKYLKKQNFFIWLYALLLILMNFVLIFTSSSVWADEVYSINLTKLPLKDLILATATDVHPPLYYIIVKFITLLMGTSTYVYRFASVLPIIILTLFGLKWIKSRFTTFSSVIFITLVSLSPQIQYNVEIRMYTWAMLFVTLTAMSAYDILTTQCKKSWISFSLFGLFAAYTHYYALLIVSFLFLCLFVSLSLSNPLRIFSCIRCLFFTALGYIPWFPILLSQFSKTTESNYWISNITFSTLKNYIIFIFGTGTYARPLLILFFLVSVFIFFFTVDGITIKQQNNLAVRNYSVNWCYTKQLTNDSLFVIWCQVAFWGNIILGVTLSWVFRPIFIDRYIVPALGLMWLTLSISCSKFKNIFLYLKFVLLIFILAVSLHYYARFYNSERVYNDITQNSLVDINQYISPYDFVASNDAHLNWVMLKYYFPDATLITNPSSIDDQKRLWYFSINDIIPPEYTQNAKKITMVSSYQLDIYDFDLYLINY